MFNSGRIFITVCLKSAGTINERMIDVKTDINYFFTAAVTGGLRLFWTWKAGLLFLKNT